MRTESNAIRGHAIVLPRLDIEGVKERAKTVFTKDSIVALALLGSTFMALGVLVFALCGAMQANTLVGISPYLSSFNWQLSMPAY